MIAKGFVSRFDLRRTLRDDSGIETNLSVSLVESWENDHASVDVVFRGVKSLSYLNMNDAVWLVLVQADARDKGWDEVSYRVYDPEHQTGFELYCSSVECG